MVVTNILDFYSSKFIYFRKITSLVKVAREQSSTIDILNLLYLVHPSIPHLGYKHILLEWYSLLRTLKKITYFWRKYIYLNPNEPLKVNLSFQFYIVVISYRSNPFLWHLWPQLVAIIYSKTKKSWKFKQKKLVVNGKSEATYWLFNIFT